MTRLVLLGVSARALAQSGAGPPPGAVAVDFFGDRDLTGVAEVYALGRDLGLAATAEALGEAADLVGAEAVVYGANLENHPEVVEKLSRRAQIVGNDADVLREVRDWRRLRECCWSAKIAHATTLLPGEEEAARRGGRWLVKRVHSGGGHGVRPWRGESIDARHVLQEYVEGRPASIGFVADGRDCRVFTFCEQLAGRAALGARGFTWCGNLLPFETAPGDQPALQRQLAGLASGLTRRFGLRGVNGADVIVGPGPDGRRCAYLVEVNPRYCASMELAWHAYGLDALALHLQACAGRLPDTAADRPATVYHGKGIVYARGALTLPTTDGWYVKGRRDIPYRGQQVAAGHPVCTVLAHAADRKDCLARLDRQAADVYEEIHAGTGERRERTPHLDNGPDPQAGDRHAQGQAVR
jgi:predicted ATP-grasp superfamily ATP-dependent carboligase